MWQEKHKITLAIVDDHPIVIQGLEHLLAAEEQISIAGSFTTGAGLLAFLNTAKTDIVLLDISLPDIDGIALCRTIKTRWPGTCVVALSNHSERSIILQALQSGANGYLLKNADAGELMQCIGEALNGQITFSKDVKEIIARPSANELKNAPRLTRREKEILQLIAAGKTTSDMAQQLSLSPLTVETHRKNLMQKFEVRNAAALIKAAVEQRLL